MTNRDTLTLAVLAALALCGVIALAAVGVTLPEVLTHALTLLLGALTGASLPARGTGR